MWQLEWAGRLVELAGPPIRRDDKNVSLRLAGEQRFDGGGIFVSEQIGFYLPTYPREKLPRVVRPDGDDWDWRP